MSQYGDDSLLIRELKQGSQLAFEELYHKYSGKIFNAVSCLVYDKTLAKDITQSCFLTIWEKRDAIDPDKNFSAYLYTIAKNLVYKETKRLVLDSRFVEIKLHSDEKFEDNTIDNLNNSYIEAYLNQLVNELSPVPREIFLLKNNQEHSIKNIATKMDMTERSVEAHLYRTMKHLKEKLKKFYFF